MEKASFMLKLSSMKGIGGKTSLMEEAGKSLHLQGISTKVNFKKEKQMDTID